MNFKIIMIILLIPMMEFGNLLKGGNSLSSEAITLISITSTLASVIYSLKVEKKKANNIFCIWLCFMVLFFSLGLGNNIIRIISPISNTLSVFGFIFPILYNSVRKKH